MHESKAIILRPFEEEDLENYRGWVNDPDLASLVDRVLPITRWEHEKWYFALQNNKNAVVFAINSGICYIGNVWLWDIDWRYRKAEVRIIIGDKNYHGKGLGTEAIELIVAFAFVKLNLNRVYAYVLASNGRANRAFEKAGFSVEGILRRDRFIDGKYADVLLMGKLADG